MAASLPEGDQDPASRAGRVVPRCHEPSSPVACSPPSPVSALLLAACGDDGTPVADASAAKDKPAIPTLSIPPPKRIRRQEVQGGHRRPEEGGQADRRHAGR